MIKFHQINQIELRDDRRQWNEWLRVSGCAAFTTNTTMSTVTTRNSCTFLCLCMYRVMRFEYTISMSLLCRIRLYRIGREFGVKSVLCLSNVTPRCVLACPNCMKISFERHNKMWEHLWVLSNFWLSNCHRLSHSIHYQSAIVRRKIDCCLRLPPIILFSLFCDAPKTAAHITLSLPPPLSLSSFVFLRILYKYFCRCLCSE